MSLYDGISELIDYAPYLAISFSTYLIGTLSPGPANLAIMGVSMSHGRASGLYMAVGVISGSLCWGIVAALGLATLLSSFGSALLLLKLLGGLYLLWLAYKALRAASAKHDKRARFQAKNLTRRGFFLKGLGIHLTNPKAAFTWSAVITLGLPPNDKHAIMAFAIVIGCWILGVLIFSAYALIFSSRRMVAFYSGFRRSIESVLALLFGFAGIKLLLSLK